jgi:hypothetical protein
MSSGARNPMMSRPPNPTPRGMETLLAEFERRVVADAAAARHLSRSNARHLEVVNTGREPAFSGSRPAAMNAPPGAHSYDQRAFHAPVILVVITSDMGPPPRPRPHDMGRSSSTGTLSPSGRGGMMGPPPRRQRPSGSFPHMAQSPTLRQHSERGGVADRRPEYAVFPDAIRSMGEQGGYVRNAGHLPPFGYRPHNMGLPATEDVVLRASPSDMGPPPKRQLLAGTFARQHTEHSSAEMDWQRHDQQSPPSVVGQVRSMGERLFEERGRQPEPRAGRDPDSRTRHEDDLRKRTR